MTPRIKYLEEEVCKLNLELCGIDDYVHGDFGDPLTVKSKDVEIFVGTLQDLERWMQGFKFARQRKWVGLTDEEASSLADNGWEEAFVRLIEEKLKEKNGG